MLHAVKLSAIRIAVFAIQPLASLPFLPEAPVPKIQVCSRKVKRILRGSAGGGEEIRPGWEESANVIGRETRLEGVWLSTADDERLSPGS